MTDQLVRCFTDCRRDSEHDTLGFHSDSKLAKILRWSSDISATDNHSHWQETPILSESWVDNVNGLEDELCPKRQVAQIACIPTLVDRDVSTGTLWQFRLAIQKSHWNTLLRVFELTDVRQRAHTNPSMSSVVPHYMDGRIVGLSYSLYVSRLVGMYFTYDPVRGVYGNGVVWALPDIFEELQTALSRLTHLAQSPFCLLLAMVVAIVSSNDRRLIDHHGETIRIETTTGMRGWFEHFHLPFDESLTDLHGRVSRLEIMHASNKRLATLLLNMMEAVREEVLNNERMLLATWQIPVDALTKDMAFLERHLREQLNTTQYLNDRAQVQMQAILNKKNEQQMALSQEIAENSLKTAHATKRDSSSMKILAAMTVLFLPGTFIASLLSTSMFDWRFEEGAIVSAQFWCYWAIAVPLTFLVIGVTFVWSSWAADRAERQDDEGAKNMEEHLQQSVLHASSISARPPVPLMTLTPLRHRDRARKEDVV